MTFKTNLMKKFRNHLIQQLFFFILMSFLAGVYPTFSVQQENHTGTYKLTAEGTTLTLVLSETQGILTGTLTSTTGVRFNLKGTVSEGIGEGICSSNQGSVYFETYLAGHDLTLSLIEPDAQNLPNYDNAQYLVFSKQSGVKTTAPAVTDQLFGNQEQKTQTQGNPTVQKPVMPAQAVPANNAGGGSQIGDKSWGFTFKPPPGWNHQQGEDMILLGHNTIPGLIVVIPHMVESGTQLQSEMQKGIQEEGVNLVLSGMLGQQSSNSLVGDYSGIWENTQVKAKCIGTLSPYGGGAYILAVTTPDKFGQDIISAAHTVEQNLNYVKVNMSELMQHFAGQWTSFTSNTTTWLYLYPNGIYSEDYEASYAGDFTNDVGDITGNWGATGQSSDRGKWIVRGNKESGKIIVKLANGNELVFNYKVHVERGETYYSEYWFNGRLYNKSPIK